MLRKLAHVSLAVFLVLAFAAMASAAPDVASTSKKGSLLVFPKVVNTATAETYLFIANDSTVKTYVKCYWMDKNQNIEDFEFEITANQPIVFSTNDNAYGPQFADNSAGALTCWTEALDPTQTFLKFAKFDHLYGYAMIKSDEGNVFYNATSFSVTADAATIAGYCPNDVTCNLPLGGSGQIDACPKYLVTTFVTGFVEDNSTILPSYTRGGVANRSAGADLALWPCRQDLRQDRTPTYTKAKFDVWNGHEVKFTGAYQCFKCFFEGYLDSIGNYTDNFPGTRKGFGADKFYGDRLRTPVARLRVQGVASTVCTPAAAASPLLGVLTYADPTAVGGFMPYAGHTLFGAGFDLSGFIAYDNGGAVAAPRK